MNLADKKVLVVGTGISGIAATELLVGQKIETVLFDGNKELDREKLYAKSEVWIESERLYEVLYEMEV